MGANKRVDIKTGFICNNNCRFCVQAHNKFKGNRHFEEIKKDLINARKRCDSVVLTGGEATIRKDFFDIVKFAKKLGYNTIQIQTNGRMFSSLDFCKKAIKAGANEFSPALHGYCAKQHDFLTRVNGSFKQTVKGIRNLKSLNAFVLTNTVVVKQNYKNLPEIAKLLVKLNVDQFQFAFVHPIGNAWKNFNRLVPRVSLASYYIKKGLDIGIKAGKMVMAEAMPYCLMVGYEDYISEQFIPETEIAYGNNIFNEDYKKTRINEGKTKFKQCKKCKYNKICEGPWKEYPKKYGDTEFSPVIKKYGPEKLLYINAIKKRGINVPNIKRFGDGSVIFDWINGINLKQYLDDNPKKNSFIYKKLAKALGKIHNNSILPVSKEEAEKNVKKIIESRMQNLGDKGIKFYKKIKEILEKQFPKEFIPDIIHGDFWSKNILINKNQLYLIDFEDVCRSFLEFDVLHNFFDNSGFIFINIYKKQNNRTRTVYNNIMKNKLFYRTVHFLMSNQFARLKKAIHNA